VAKLTAVSGGLRRLFETNAALMSYEAVNAQFLPYRFRFNKQDESDNHRCIAVIQLERVVK
jgi:hypothetical protein